MIAEGARDWATYALGLVRGRDESACLCLDGEEWLVETEVGPARELLGVRVVEVGVGWKRIVSTKEAA